MNYKPGDLVQVRDPASNQWRDAMILRLASYVGRSGPGWDYCWDPLPTDYSSQGGWTCVKYTRPRP